MVEWVEILPTARAAAHLKPAVRLTLDTASKRFAPSCSLMVRLSSVPGVDFFTPGAKVNVQVGKLHGVDMMRVVPGKNFKVARSGGVGMDCLKVRIPAPTHCKKGERIDVAVEFDFNEKWLQITLPAWWSSVDSKAAPVPSPAPVLTPVKPKPAAFKSAADSVQQRMR